MFKKLMSVVIVSMLALSAWAEPQDQVELDLIASRHRAMKIELDAREALKAAYVRNLKANIAATEMAVRRLKNRLAVTKDQAKREAIEARVAVLEDEAKTMSEEAKGEVEVTVGQAAAAQQPATQPQPVKAAAAGPFKHVAGVWSRTSQGATYVMVISATGELLTDANHGAAFTRSGQGVLLLTYNGSLTKATLTRLSATRCRFVDIEWTRVSPEVPEPSVLCDKTDYKDLGGTSGRYIDDNHIDGLRKFVKDNPVK